MLLNLFEIFLNVGSGSSQRVKRKFSACNFVQQFSQSLCKNCVDCVFMLDGLALGFIGLVAFLDKLAQLYPKISCNGYN